MREGIHFFKRTLKTTGRKGMFKEMAKKPEFGELHSIYWITDSSHFVTFCPTGNKTTYSDRSVGGFKVSQNNKKTECSILPFTVRPSRTRGAYKGQMQGAAWTMQKAGQLTPIKFLYCKQNTGHSVGLFTHSDNYFLQLFYSRNNCPMSTAVDVLKNLIVPLP